MLVDGFRPASESVEWLAGASYWEAAGRQAFVRDRVPHLGTNDGVRAAWAADVLFASCEAAERSGTLEDAVGVLELGAGLGLHAKFLLDRFQARAAAAGVDYYERLTFEVTDASSQMVADLEEIGTFADHRDHVRLAVVDAIDPIGVETGVEGLRAVFHNYLLDTLPFDVVVRREGWHRLHLRGSTHGGDEAAADTAYLPVEPGTLPWIDHLDALACGEEPIVVSHGAVESLLQTIDLLRPDGFVLWSDYGGGTIARFAGARAMGVNFALVDRILAAVGARVVAPEGDETATLRARLVHRAADPLTIAAFTRAYDEREVAALASLRDRAHEARADGRLDEADACYGELHQRCPHGWLVLLEWAELTLYERGDASRGLQLAERAAAMNPTGRPLVHNVVGDALVALGRFDDAAAAFERALRVAPADARAHASRARLLARDRRYGEAIASAERAIALDGGRHRALFEAVLAEIVKEQATPKGAGAPGL